MRSPRAGVHASVGRHRRHGRFLSPHARPRAPADRGRLRSRFRGGRADGRSGGWRIGRAVSLRRALVASTAAGMRRETATPAAVIRLVGLLGPVRRRSGRRLHGRAVPPPAPVAAVALVDGWRLPTWTTRRRATGPDQPGPAIGPKPSLAKIMAAAGATPDRSGLRQPWPWSGCAARRSPFSTRCGAGKAGAGFVGAALTQGRHLRFPA